MGLKVHTPPTIEPITLDEAKLHLKVDADEHDAQIESLITAARLVTEHYLNRKLINTVINEYYNSFGDGVVRLSVASVQSVTSIIYADSEGDEQTLSADKYQLDNVNEPCKVYFLDMPTLKDGAVNAIKIQYVSGYGATAADVPNDIKQAIFLKIGDLFEHPTDAPRTLTTASKRLLYHHRVHTF